MRIELANVQPIFFTIIDNNKLGGFLVYFTIALDTYTAGLAMYVLLITVFSYFEEEISWDTKGFEHSDQARIHSFDYYNISKRISDNSRVIDFISKFWLLNPVLGQGNFLKMKTIAVSQRKIVLQMQTNIQNVATSLCHIFVK